MSDFLLLLWFYRSLSDFSDYDSSEEEYRAAHSRQASRNATTSSFDPYSYKNTGPSNAGGAAAYRSLDDENEGATHSLMDPNDPFGDPFADENESVGQGQAQGKRRMEWAEI